MTDHDHHRMADDGCPHHAEAPAASLHLAPGGRDHTGQKVFWNEGQERYEYWDGVAYVPGLTYAEAFDAEAKRHGAARAAQEEARKPWRKRKPYAPRATGDPEFDTATKYIATKTDAEALPEVVSKPDHDLIADLAGPMGRPAVLPTGYDEHKSIPIATGLLDYFPKACAAVAVVSRIGNDQHNPGEPLHWARGKSMDQDNTAIRHFLERGGFDTDGARHTAKAAWRMLARLELEIEADGLGFERGAA